VEEALREDGWIDDIQGEMTVELWMQSMRLWEAVETVERDFSSPDRISWKCAESGTYTAKGTYKMLCLESVRWSMSKLVWVSSPHEVQDVCMAGYEVSVVDLG
jgi:hypothetical protein